MLAALLFYTIHFWKLKYTSIKLFLGQLRYSNTSKFEAVKSKNILQCELRTLMSSTCHKNERDPINYVQWEVIVNYTK
jgi:hypothetical protein